jgi:phage terminase Nu1 subunit (DNA packaging protein)
MDESQAVIPIAELAARLGISTRHAYEHAASGVLIRVGKGFDFDASLRGYLAHLRRAATGRRGPGKAGAAGAKGDERARLARVQADAIETKNKAAAGRLLDADAVRDEWVSILRTVREALLAAPQRCAARRPQWGADDVAAVDVEMLAILTSLANDEHV